MVFLPKSRFALPKRKIEIRKPVADADRKGAHDGRGAPGSQQHRKAAIEVPLIHINAPGQLFGYRCLVRRCPKCQHWH
jgi:hypothetical protein